MCSAQIDSPQYGPYASSQTLNAPKSAWSFKHIYIYTYTPRVLCLAFYLFTVRVLFVRTEQMIVVNGARYGWLIRNVWHAHIRTQTQAHHPTNANATLLRIGRPMVDSVAADWVNALTFTAGWPSAPCRRRPPVFVICLQAHLPPTTVCEHVQTWGVLRAYRHRIQPCTAHSSARAVKVNGSIILGIGVRKI